MNKLFFITALLTAPILLVAQSGGLDPADILKPLSDQWASYSGDMTGKRYSALKQINTQTVKNLSLRWVNNNITTACGPAGTGAAGSAAPPAATGRGGGGRGGGGAATTGAIIPGGFGTGEVNTCGPTRFGGGILFVDGVLYGASQNDVYAIDARTTIFISSCTTIGLSVSMHGPAARCGRKKSRHSSSSIFHPMCRW